MSQESPRLTPGTVVDARGERWRVVESIEHEGCATCRLVGAAGSNLGVGRSLLLPFDRPRAVRYVPRWTHVGRRRWVLACRALMGSDATAAGLRGVADARLDLLADEVGLGKTVQAGVILADLCARADSIRALVLCPAGLCGQWERELADRFGLRATVVDLAALRRRFRQAGPGSVPWDHLPLAIASVDFVKRPEVLQGMAHIRWDLLVVDEAHLSALAAERAAAVSWLARRSRRVALLTATPHPGESGAFEALCRVGRLAGDGPVLMFRRTRASLGLPARRRARVLALRLSPAERHLHASLRRYCARVWNAGAAGPQGVDARLAMIVLAKRAASGPAPLLASLERRLHWLDRIDDSSASQLLLPLGEPDQDEADDEPGATLAAPGLTSRKAEIAIVAGLIDLARVALPFDSKTRALMRLLRRVREPAIVFTEYRDALSRAADQLSPSLRAAVVHGGLDRRARNDALRWFTNGDADVLLATDAAAHGLNLQARCRLVIDLDLPWNPVRLEQRIGRVDRIGQHRVVHAVHLVGRGTTEAVVLGRLAARTTRARMALGDAADPVGAGAEMAVADAVFRPRARESAGTTPRGRSAQREDVASEPVGPADLFRRADLSPVARAEVSRLTGLRQLRARGGAVLHGVTARLDRAGPWWTVLAFREAAPSRLLAVFRAEAVDGRGLVLEQILVPVEAEVGGVTALPPSTLSPRLAAAAAGAAREKLAAVRAAALPRLEAECAREAALDAVAEAVPVVAVQAGLFDRRALRRAEEARQGRASLQDETRVRLDDLRRAARVDLAEPPRLVLVALVRGS